MPYSQALKRLTEREWQPVELTEPVPIAQLPTPALLIDESALERNLKRMATYLADKGKGLRPHAKTHKCPIIAQRQLALGAVGVCAAKVSEAVVLVNSGVDAVLITSAVLSENKAEIVGDLARKSDELIVVVDSDQGLELLLRHVPEGTQLGVIVDVDVSMGRTGTRDETQIVKLAERCVNSTNLRYRGIQHYAGHLMHVEGYEKRREKSLSLWQRISEICEMLGDRGLAPEIVTGAGTGTYNIDCGVSEITDLQTGSYIFMDQEYRLIGAEQGGLFDDFEVSLSVVTTAISQPVAGLITVDGGYKAFASDTVNPEPMTIAGSKYRFGGDEHGIVILEKGTQEPVLGGIQQFITPHCDPTVNLHDGYWVCNDGLVHSFWPIAARGCSW
ncbi:MAG: DSD1 family PLP-dependent enzyme [Gammaproteobacteria bacterium]|nr:DSD1 family PLP-dependent enzyme [Gammaproteobacteria bacterium]